MRFGLQWILNGHRIVRNSVLENGRTRKSLQGTDPKGEQF